MKTYYFLSKNLSVYSLFGLIALVFTSCASYQNKNYDETDGIYSNSSRKQNTTTEDSGYYKGYFGSLQDNSQVITDVENYYSETDSIQGDSIRYANRNAGWGSSSQDINVTLYDNSFGWGYSPFWNAGWGWGWNGWYGSGWGWGLGWGYNPWFYGGWGYYNPYWYGGWGGHYHNNFGYAYGNGPRYSGNYGVSPGRRTTAYTSGRYASTGRRTDATFRTSNNRNSYTVRNSPNTRFTTRNSGMTRNSNYVPSRNTTRNTTVSPTRNNSYTPSRNTSPTRSYTPSSGGGRSSGGSYGGGGRSGGGGGRRG